MAFNDNDKELDQLVKQVKELENSYNSLACHISQTSYWRGFVEGQLTITIENLRNFRDRGFSERSRWEEITVNQMCGVVSRIQSQIELMRFPFYEEKIEEQTEATPNNTETHKSFKDIAQDFLDELNQLLEMGNYEPSLGDNLNDLCELLNATVEHL